MLKRLIQDKKGSALVLSICLLAIIAILAVGMAGVTSMVYKKTTYDVNRQQAYFNAKSGIETALNSIVSQKDDALIQAIRNAGGTLVSDPIEFADGTYTLTLRLLNSDPDNPQLSVTATGEDHGKKYSISSKVEGSITRTKPPFAVTHALDMNGNAQLKMGIKIFAEKGHGVISRSKTLPLTLGGCYVKGGIEAQGPIYEGDMGCDITYPVMNYGFPYIEGDIFLFGNQFYPRGLYLTDNFYSVDKGVIDSFLIPDDGSNARGNYGRFSEKFPRNKNNTFFDSTMTPSPALDSPELPSDYYTWNELKTATRTFNGVTYKLYEEINGVPTINTSAGDVFIVASESDVMTVGTRTLGGSSVNISSDLNIIGDGNVGIYVLSQHVSICENTVVGRHLNSDKTPTNKTKLYFVLGNNEAYFYGNQTISAYFLSEKEGTSFQFAGDGIKIYGGLRGQQLNGTYSRNIEIYYVPTEDGFVDGGGSSSTNASWSVGGFQKGDGK